MIDGHMHLEYGPLNVDYVMQFINEAKHKGIDEIQILDHTHRFMEFEPMYEPLKKIEVQKIWLENKNMKFKDHVSDFIALMKQVQNMESGIKVKYGLEVCYTPEAEEFIRNVLNQYEFDFVVGSIHSIDGILYDMPFSKALLWDKHSADHIYKRYYECLMKCVNSDLFTQLGHPDTIKMFNVYPDYDLSDTYEALSEALKAHHVKAECNVGCYYRYHHKDLGLSDELLKCFIKHDVEIITASDAHKPQDAGNYIKEATERIEDYYGKKD